MIFIQISNAWFSLCYREPMSFTIMFNHMFILNNFLFEFQIIIYYSLWVGAQFHVYVVLFVPFHFEI